MLTERKMDTKVCSKCKEVKTLDGFSKDKAKKDGCQSECKACNKEHNAEYRAANPEKRKEYDANYRADNSEKIREYQVEYRAANPDYHAEYYAANIEKIKDYQAEYQKANPEKFRANCANRRAVELEAIPSWLTQEDYKAMQDIHKEAARLTKETGIKHEVDHIHPLRGKLICGLQCPSNLQILTRSENRSKSNKFMPYVESA